MLKEVVFVSIYLVSISGCALTDTPDAEVKNQNTANDASDSQAQTAGKESATATPLADQSGAPAAADKDVGVESVKQIQARPKGLGFYSGSVDGVVDGDTQTAIRRFHSACVSLEDLIRNTHDRAVRPSAGVAAA